MAQRDFSAELQAARDAQDWAAHERIWEERRLADVAADEADLHALPARTATENAAEPPYEAAIKEEAIGWAAFFGVTNQSEIEARERVMRANAAVGHVGPLLQFIEASERPQSFKEDVRSIAEANASISKYRQLGYVAVVPPAVQAGAELGDRLGLPGKLKLKFKMSAA